MGNGDPGRQLAEYYLTGEKYQHLVGGSVIRIFSNMT